MPTVAARKHVSLFYSSEEEYCEAVIPLIKSGLEDNEFILWVIPEFMSVEDASNCLRRSLENLAYYIDSGQILIQDHKAVYFKEGYFSLRIMMDQWEELEKRALGKGFNGVFAVGDGGWALGDHWLDFLMYEYTVNSTIGAHKLRALCTYSKKNIEIEKICDIGKCHQEAIVKQGEAWNRLAPEDF